MKLPVEQRRVSRVLLDFDLSIEFDNGASIAFSEVVIDGLTVDEDNQFEGLRAFAALHGLVCEDADYDESGVLCLTFEGRQRVVAAPRDEVESWEYTAVDGSTVLCGPGGAVESWPAPEHQKAETPTVERLPAIGATVVRLSTGDDPAVEFSDGTKLLFDLALDAGYLVLRESVTSSSHSDGAATEGDWVVELSSGHVIFYRPRTV
ncbi:DUF6188 family protein [Rhodococcus sp. IEGM 1401]|uniref:DUF6188 family protein n=1 Tax=unclassified Rhodococcus (in: high G+C Gram-positive bacteria) TaxID=192944 RepID=UPI0022B2BC41|nr:MULTISPECIES: DUF6188 family protein [unclassified Rhodococcus (in: high G+C Gram-positive bacteria)]MCZ4561303.1 DUF6188 family protein [Rhodococcus sp. IEGM 1401]MDI9921569.1 DUF6188 family protein [Rhodococcus sp. IEGM 1372]MDV8033899.1 DUF6188 family protein [Rhodococcus sp. IEGM 1414]